MALGGLLVLAACSTKVDPLFSPGSSAMALSADGSTLFVADQDNGALARVNLATGDLRTVLLGMEPTRIARIGDTLYVTLRAERAIAVVDIQEGGDVAVRGVYPVGAEPYGIVASPDGLALYVALSMEDAVVQVDPGTLAPVARYAVPGEPRWLAIHPQGSSLFVGTARAGVWRIDLLEGQVRQLRLPHAQRQPGRAEPAVDLTPRVTGDLAVTPAGDVLAIPVLYVDNETSAGPADPLEGGEVPVDDGVSRTSSGYASRDVEGIARFNPAVVTMALSGGDARDDEAHAVLVSGRSAVDAFVAEPLMGEESFDTFGFREDGGGSLGRQTRGYLTSLAFNPTGTIIAATIEGGRTVAFVPTHPVQGGVPTEEASDDIFRGDGVFESTPRVLVGTDHGPAAVLFTPAGEALSWSFMGRTVARIQEGTVDRVFGRVDDRLSVTSTWTAELPWSLGPSILPPDVVEGRRLFYSSSDDAMAFAGAGVSCATCHSEGRNDGLTWTFDHGKRQTPSLAGPVSHTSPVTWTNDVGTVDDEVKITSQGRMGGAGVSRGQLADVAAFIDWTRDVDVPMRGATDPAIARGKAIFERADTGCATCHSGERHTDNKLYAMFGVMGVNTPGLVGLAASGPYLHDGSAATLRDVLLRADAGGMGSTKGLSAQEMADLETYLRSL